MDSFEKIILITCILLIMFGVPTLVIMLEKHISCPSFGEITQLETKYNFLAGGCFVKYEGQWVNRENFRVGTMD